MYFVTITFLARLDKVQEELLYYPRRRHWHWRWRWRYQNVKVSTLKFIYVMGKVLSGELYCPCDRSCYLKSFLPSLKFYEMLSKIFMGWLKSPPNELLLLFWFSGELDNISSTTFIRDLYIQTKYDRRISGLLGHCSVKIDGTFSHCCYDSKHFLSQSMVTIATGLVVINVGQEHVLCLNLISKHLQDLKKVNTFRASVVYVISNVCLCF